MKTKFKLLTCLILIAWSISSFAQSDGNGDTTKGGGGVEAADFASVAQRFGAALDVFCRIKINLAPCKKLSEIFRMIVIMKVTDEPVVFGPDGKPRDAINNKKNKITLGSTRWKEILKETDSAESRVRLVAHEILSLMEMEDSDSYIESGLLVDEMKTSFINLALISGKSNPPVVATSPDNHKKYKTHWFREYSNIGQLQTCEYLKENEPKMVESFKENAASMALGMCRALQYEDCVIRETSVMMAQSKNGPLGCFGYATATGISWE